MVRDIKAKHIGAGRAIEDALPEVSAREAADVDHGLAVLQALENRGVSRRQTNVWDQPDAEASGSVSSDGPGFLADGVDVGGLFLGWDAGVFFEELLGLCAEVSARTGDV